MASKRQKKIPGRGELGRVLGWLVICSLAVVLSGCIGAIIGQFTGRRSETVKVEAKYKLESGNLLILVDTPSGVARSSEARSVLSSKLEREIAHYELAANVIPASELSALRSSRDDFEELDIRRIGQELWAQQVLYVEITEFQLSSIWEQSAGQSLMQGRVKVFDVEQNRRVWPEIEPLGYEVIVRTRLGEGEGKNQQELMEELCQRMSVKIVKLFRDHQEPRVLANAQ